MKYLFNKEVGLMKKNCVEHGIARSVTVLALVFSADRGKTRNRRDYA